MKCKIYGGVESLAHTSVPQTGEEAQRPNKAASGAMPRRAHAGVSYEASCCFTMILLRARTLLPVIPAAPTNYLPLVTPRLHAAI